MTLSSGLDDYPRAQSPSENERHLDLLCWMAKGSSVLQQLARHVGDEAKADEYGELAAELAAGLVPLHWNQAAGEFHDWGSHDNEGNFATMIVVRCVNSRDEGIDAMVNPKSPNPREDCPRSHPHFKFPLGDGRGGIMEREKYLMDNEKLQHVHHMGYVAIFPLMLRLLPADAPQLGAVLDSIRDPEQLWTPWGLRSLSKKSNYFQRGNAPGDAPYWRGPIWINIQWLALYGLHHYGHTPGPHQAKAKGIYKELRENVMQNLRKEWERTGFLWEQYSEDTGKGQRAHPFNGWSSLVVAIMGEDF